MMMLVCVEELPLVLSPRDKVVITVPKAGKSRQGKEGRSGGVLMMAA